MPTVYLTLLILALSTPVLAQNSKNADIIKKLSEKAATYYNNNEFTRAVKVYKELDELGSRSAARKLGDCYRLMNDLNSARPYYARVVEEENADERYFFYYAQCLIADNDYENALAWLLKYKEYDNVSTMADKLIESCKNAIAGNSTPASGYTLINLKFNSAGSDFGPAFTSDGIIFTSSRMESFIQKRDKSTNTGYLDMYTVPVNWKDTTAVPERIKGSVNTLNFHEGPGCLSPDRQLLYFTRNNVMFGTTQSSRSGEIKLKIYEAQRSGSAWKGTRELEFNGNEYSCAYPAVTSDNSVIFFASDKSGGYGGTDIYYSKYDSVKHIWGKPVNAGPEVNTTGDERFPFIHSDGTLYFSSNGHVGYGGLDIYSASPDRDDPFLFSHVVNMGPPFNSNMDDLSFIIDANRMNGYFASNRSGGAGSDDIYGFTTATVRLKIDIAFEDSTLTNGFVTVIDADRNIRLYSMQPATHSFYGRLEPNRTYKVRVEKNGFTTAEFLLESGRDGDIIGKFTVLHKSAIYPENNTP